MIKVFITITLFCSSVFLSCSNGNAPTLLFDQESSLRNQSTNRALEVEWTGEGELPVDNFGELQSTDTATPQDESLENTWSATTELSSEFSGEMESIFIARLERDEPIYPQLQGFGSLNISILPPPLLSMVESFLQSIQAENIESIFFPETKLYFKTLIEYDLQSLPQLKTWILGEPFLLAGDTRLVFEIPVRLVFQSGFCDVFIYCADYDGMFKVEQLAIGALEK